MRRALLADRFRQVESAGESGFNGFVDCLKFEFLSGFPDETAQSSTGKCGHPAGLSETYGM